MNSIAASNERTQSPDDSPSEGSVHAQPEGNASESGGETPTSPSNFKLRNMFRTTMFRNVVGTVGSQIGIFGIQAMHSIVLARLLGPTQRGEYATAVFYSQVLLYAGLLGTLFSIARRAALSKSDESPLANSSLRTGLTTGLCCVGVVVMLAFVALPADKAYMAPLCIFAALQLPFEHARLALLSVDHGSGEFRRYNYNRLISASIFPVLLGICWLFDLISLQYVVAMVVISSALGLAQLIYVHSEVRWKKPAAPPVKVLLKEGLPYSAGYFAAQLLGRLDSLLVLWLMSFTNQGLYAVALAASALLLIVPNALALFAFNMGAKATLSRSRRSLRLAALGVLSIQIVSAILFALILSPLLTLLFGSKFAGALPATLALLPGLAIEGTGTVAEAYLRGRGRPFSTLRPHIIGAAVMIPTVFLLYNRWPDLCVPLGSSVAHAVSGVAILWVFINDNLSTTESE